MKSVSFINQKLVLPEEMIYSLRICSNHACWVVYDFEHVEIFTEFSITCCCSCDVEVQEVLLLVCAIQYYKKKKKKGWFNFRDWISWNSYAWFIRARLSPTSRITIRVVKLCHLLVDRSSEFLRMRSIFYIFSSVLLFISITVNYYSKILWC